VAQLLLVRRMSASRVTVVLALCSSLLLLVEGLIGLTTPDVFAGVVRFMQTSPAIYAAAAVRVAIGIVLLQAASTSQLPIFLRILGGFVLLGGLLHRLSAGSLPKLFLAGGPRTVPRWCACSRQFRWARSCHCICSCS
jgi:hypothetical protein